MDLSLYLVTDRSLLFGRRLEDVVEQAVAGGVTIVQLREKESSSREFYELAMSLKQMLCKYHVPLIINDRLDIALACNADGIHIGQSDLPYGVIRELLGYDKIIGLSVENIDEVVIANKLDVDYIALSPLFSTQTKLDIKTPFGGDGLRKALKMSQHKTIAIGGISLDNIDKCVGLDGVAVVSAIMSSDNPKQAACDMKAKIDDYMINKIL